MENKTWINNPQTRVTNYHSSVDQKLGQKRYDCHKLGNKYDEEKKLQQSPTDICNLLFYLCLINIHKTL